MANFCEGCGAPLKETDKFCQNCGRTVEQKAPEPAQQPQQNFNWKEPESFMKNIPFLYKFFESFGFGRWLNYIYIADGRINRWKYFIENIKVGLLITFIDVPLYIVAYMCLVMPTDSPGACLMLGLLTGFVALVISLLMIPPTYTLGIRRLHDLDKPGWVVLLYFIPYVGTALSLYLLFFKGTDGPTKFGPDPLQ